ncbi:MAG TPA: cbb3-type cytochrome oxidase assembly protein CcoS [Rhizomicrobium sp.]|jgi:cbb3-type cytochrome oxidase maturation protein|nr:cbb3-type cytochrome oxidase assembly protein CcoS [Rhizomicrobium sp.]
MGLIIASALLVGLASLAVLIWTLSSGQYDDLDGDAQRVLLDDDLAGDDRHS